MKATALFGRNGMKVKLVAACGAVIIAGLLSGCSSILPATPPAETAPAETSAQVDVAPSYTFSGADAENYIRDVLFERTEYGFLTGCPDTITGEEGDLITCVACPQDYAALDYQDGWLTLAGDGPWRCDAAGGGWYIDLKVQNGDLFFQGDSIRDVQ
jgi:hypothetical protein